MAKDKSWVGKIAEKGLEGVGVVVREAIMPALEKTIPQGAGELAHALNTGSAYLPYGSGQRPLDPQRANDAMGHGLPPQAQGQTQQQPGHDAKQQENDGRDM
jgi:hypothetical protein